MAVSMQLKNLDAVVNNLKKGISTKPVITMGITASGKAAAYALVWEYGRVDCNPGPKTLWSTSPVTGETVVLTKTAPNGFIRINRQSYRRFVREEVAEALQGVKLSGISNAVRKGMASAASKCADLMAETAPYDKGALRSAIRSADLSEVGVNTSSDNISIRTRLRK